MVRWGVHVMMGCALAMGGCVPAGGGGGGEPQDAAPQPDLGGGLRLDVGPAPDAGPAPDQGPELDGAPGDAALDQQLPDAAPAEACRDGQDNDGDGRVDFPEDPGCESSEDDDEQDPPTECADGVDNDGDGLIDVYDSDCTGPSDRAESGPNRETACNNGLDDDEDGLIDFPADPGCVAAGHGTEADPAPAPACANGQDDDGDGATDYPEDPGCAGRGDEDEADPATPPACANGLDDDDSGAADWPADPGCDAAGDPTEIGPCGLDVPVVDLNAWLAENEAYEGTLEGRPDRLSAVCGGGAGGEVVFRYTVDRELDRLTFSTRNPGTEAPVVMYLRDTCLGADVQCDRGPENDPGVAFTLERPEPGPLYLVVDTGSRVSVGRFRLEVEAVAPPACRDGLDNDEDGLLDLADPGCEGTEDADEQDPPEPPVCANGLDDDEDGLTDYPDDPDCAAAGYGEEQPPCRLDSPIVRLGQQGGEVQLEPVQGGGFAQASCEPGLGAETVIVLTLSEPSDVSFQLLDQAGTPVQAALHARGEDCAQADTEVGCRRAAQRAEPLELIELDRGTWFLFAEQGVVAPAAPLTARVVVTSAITECNDLVDNDEDGRVDLADPGCERGRDESEADPPEPPVCANGLDDDGDGLIDYPDDPDCEAAGDPDEDVACQGEFFGDVCVVWLSQSCVRGSAQALCAERGAEVITEQEFRSIVTAGWVRPDGGYHTLAVVESPQCPDGAANIGIPGWGNFNLFRCGDNTDYCARAVMCVTR